MKAKKENWDWILISASNNEQAKLYEKEIKNRIKKGILPKEIKYGIVVDDGTKRIGSGGATLNALKYIKEHSEEKQVIKNKKILLIHSGGDSKRIPHYSSCGKLFAPILKEHVKGIKFTVFDELILNFSNIPSKMSPGILVLCGDVLLDFNPSQITLKNCDSACISIQTPATFGCNHGVFVANEQNNVENFLHKESLKNLEKYNAIDSNNLVNIDTGVIYLGEEITVKLLSLILTENKIDKNKFEQFANEKVRLSLYGDFIYPLAENSTLKGYLEQQTEGSLEEAIECRKIIWNLLNLYNMKIVKIKNGKFQHLGTTKEFLETLNKGATKGWKRNVFSNIDKEIKYSVNTAYIDKNAKINENAYIENSYIGRNCNIGKNSIISNLNIENIVIPSEVCINTVKLKGNKFITRIYSIYDNPKERNKFLNKLLDESLKKYGIDESIIWNENEKTIWNANLFRVCESEIESIEAALVLYKIIHRNANQSDAKKYFSKERTNFRNSIEECDTEYYEKQEEKIKSKIRTYKFIKAVKNKENLNSAITILGNCENVESQIEDVLKNINKEMAYETRYRCYLALSILAKKERCLHYSYFEELCYKEIKNMITKNTKKEQCKEIKDVVDIQLPARINFGGGWTDTPPYCNENGGAVLNTAILINGEKSINTHIEKISKNAIILESKDLKIKKEFIDINELKQCNRKNDNFKIHKAALIVSGMVKKEDKSVNDVIKRCGSGFIISTDVKNIPKGSGLGTSSILAVSCLKALYEFMNLKISHKELCYKTLEQEQLMETGGGWQDPIGGLIPGIKFITTTAGYHQKFNIERIKLSDKFVDELNSRIVLIYTGKSRLAKKILRTIMNQYIESDENTILTINKIKEICKKMKKSIENEDIDEFANSLNENWEMTKNLYKGCTNKTIEEILLACDDLIQGKMICGAGGGGFLQVILKKETKKDELINKIKKVDGDIKVYDISLQK